MNRTGDEALSESYPQLLAEFDEERNLGIDAVMLSVTSDRFVWWRCSADTDHVWRAPVSRRVAGHGCPDCEGRLLDRSRSLASMRPDLASQWHSTRNGEVAPEMVAVFANRRVWWQCPADPRHEWLGLVSVRSGSGAGCPYCAGKQVLPEASFAALHPELASQLAMELSDDGFDPFAVTPQTKRRVWWRCRDNPAHVWQAAVGQRVSAKTGCPLCARERARRHPTVAEARPDLLEEWGENPGLDPASLTLGSNRRVEWRCRVDPRHVWTTAVQNRALHRRTGCPYCAGQRVLPERSLLALNPELASELHPTRNGDLTADMLALRSHQRVWWLCPRCGNEWNTPVSYRDRGGGCMRCFRGGVHTRPSLIPRFGSQSRGETCVNCDARLDYPALFCSEPCTRESRLVRRLRRELSAFPTDTTRSREAEGRLLRARLDSSRRQHVRDRVLSATPARLSDDEVYWPTIYRDLLADRRRQVY